MKHVTLYYVNIIHCLSKIYQIYNKTFVIVIMKQVLILLSTYLLPCN